MAFLSPGPKNAYAPLKRSCRKSGLASSALLAEMKTEGGELLVLVSFCLLVCAVLVVCKGSIGTLSKWT